MNGRFLDTKNESLIVRFLIYATIFYLVRNVIRNGAKQATQNAVAAGDNNALIAVEMRQAMNPSGTAWMMSFDLTDKEALFNCARKITDFAAVSRAYTDLYDSDLITDLQEELGADGFAQFQAYLGKGGATGRFYCVADGAPAYEVTNVDTSKDPIGSIGGVVKTYSLGERIDAEYVIDLGKGSKDGESFLLFKGSKWLFFDMYFVIQAKNLVLK
ncbi:hypothetical protein [Runella limosa]|uniref:hypothetical protein n=1 Tax=Runella limosa TaxID=370978 RepID=UPI00048EFE8B|nr:hypothetical protein [Runella limosa]